MGGEDTPGKWHIFILTVRLCVAGVVIHTGVFATESRRQTIKVSISRLRMDPEWGRGKDSVRATESSSE